MDKDKTTIRISKSVKKMFKKFKQYPRETDEDTLIRLIKRGLEK
jgi:hypothetical protein